MCIGSLQDQRNVLNSLQDSADRLEQHGSSLDMTDSGSNGMKLSDNTRNARETADIQQRRKEIAKQTATSLDHAAACKQTFTDWETRLAKILGDIDVDDKASFAAGQYHPAENQQHPSVGASTAEWQVCELIAQVSSDIVLAWCDLSFCEFLGVTRIAARIRR
jgi:hypothetical protein